MQQCTVLGKKVSQHALNNWESFMLLPNRSLDLTRDLFSRVVLPMNLAYRVRAHHCTAVLNNTQACRLDSFCS